jgi:hypothetical protein
VVRRLSEVLDGIGTLKAAASTSASEAQPRDPARRHEKLQRLAAALDLAEPEAVSQCFVEARPHLPAAMANELQALIDTYEYDKALVRVRGALAETASLPD